MNSALEQLATVVEKLARPGVLGAPGRVIEKRVRAELESYFQALSRSVVAVRLEELISLPKAEVRHAVEQKLYNPLRVNRSALLQTLSRGLMDGVLQGWKHDYKSKKYPPESDRTFSIIEADDDLLDVSPVSELLDQLGLTGQKAAEFAAEQSAKLVKGIDDTTRERISDVVANGIENQLGVPGTARLLRTELSNMTAFRSAMIAATEINDSFTFAALTKMKATGIEYKRLILSPDACELCRDNAAEGPIPVDEDFASGDDGPPFHPLCRCAVTGARNPNEDDDD